MKDMFTFWLGEGSYKHCGYMKVRWLTLPKTGMRVRINVRFGNFVCINNEGRMVVDIDNIGRETFMPWDVQEVAIEDDQ